MVSKNIEKNKCNCIIPDRKTIELLRDKLNCSSFMKTIGVSVPDFLSKDDNCERILRDRIGVGSKGIRLLKTGEKCPEFDRDASFLQRRVSGDEYTVDVLCAPNGSPIYIVPRKRIEVKSGVATKV